MRIHRSLFAAFVAGAALLAPGLAEAQTALNYHGGSMVLNSGGIANVRVGAIGTPNVSFAYTVPSSTSYAVAPAVTRTPSASVSSSISNMSFSAPSISSLGISSSAIGSRSLGTGASSAINNLSVAGRSVTGLNVSAFALGNGGSASASISNTRITASGLGSNVVSGNTIRATAVGNSSVTRISR